MTTRQIDLGNLQRAVGPGAGAEDDGVVEVPQVRQFHVEPVADVADEPDLVATQHPLQRLDDLLDARMVRSDPIAHQSVRGRQLVEDVDPRTVVLLGEDVGGVDTRRSRTDDGDPDAPHALPPL